MNANNLMAVTPADGISAGAGAPKGRSGSAGDRAQLASGKNSFSDTFGALQKGMDAGAAKSEMRGTSVDAPQTKLPQTESDAPSQDTQDVTAQTPKIAGQKKLETGEKNAVPVDVTTVPTAAVAALAALVNTEAAVDGDVNEGLDDALTDILKRYELTAEKLGDTKLRTAVQTLLQQPAEEGAKSRNLLLALEGQPLVQKPENAQLTVPQSRVVQETLPVLAQSAETASPALRLAALETVLPAQLRAVLRPETVPSEVQLPVMEAETLPVTETAAHTVQRSLVNALPTAEAQMRTMTAAEMTAATVLRPQTQEAQRSLINDLLTAKGQDSLLRTETIPTEAQFPVMEAETMPAAHTVQRNLVNTLPAAEAPQTQDAQRSLVNILPASGAQEPQMGAVTETITAPILNSQVQTVPQSLVNEIPTADAQEPQLRTVTAAETIAAPVLRAQTQEAQPAVRAELAVETQTADDGASNPLTVLAQRTMRHDTSQRDTAGQGAQQKQTMQQGEAPQPARMTAAAPFEIPTRPMETAPQPAQPIAAQTPAANTSVQATVSPAPTQEPQRPQPDYEIPRQIVEQARLLRTLTDTQMVIRLRPEHLGELTLRVAVARDGAVQASFHSDNAQVRNVIENSLVQLRQELNNQGLKVDRVGVYTGLADGQMPQGQGQEAWQQSSSHRGETTYYGRGDADDYLDEIDGIAPVAAEAASSNTAADGVDYRV